MCGRRNVQAGSARFGMFDASLQIAPQDLMRAQILHDEERLRLVEMIDLGDAAGIARGLAGQRLIFEERAFQRQRPTVADQAHVGQRLLDDDAAPRAFDDEHEIEIAVADFAHAPRFRRRSEPFAQEFAEPVRQRIDGQGLVGRFTHRLGRWLAGFARY